MAGKKVSDESIIEALKRLGSPTHAAKELGMDVTNVYKRRDIIQKRYGISLPSFNATQDSVVKTIIPARIKNDFWAIGTGSAYAVAAMHLGLSPAEAVKLACLYDTSSHEPVDEMRLGGVRGRKKNIG